MIDEAHRNSFKEVYDILENTEDELVKKIPIKFINFLKENMNEKYKTNIKKDEEIHKQYLLKETEAILSLIYRSYWTTDKEKKEILKKDKQENIEKENKDIYQVFEERKNINKIALDNNLMVIKKENFITKFFNKILSIFKKGSSTSRVN